MKSIAETWAAGFHEGNLGSPTGSRPSRVANEES
jgi:hypothetical protein